MALFQYSSQSYNLPSPVAIHLYATFSNVDQDKTLTANSTFLKVAFGESSYLSTEQPMDLVLAHFNLPIVEAQVILTKDLI